MTRIINTGDSSVQLLHAVMTVFRSHWVKKVTLPCKRNCYAEEQIEKTSVCNFLITEINLLTNRETQDKEFYFFQYCCVGYLGTEVIEFAFSIANNNNNNNFLLGTNTK